MNLVFFDMGGLAGSRQEKLNEKTPLEHAETPNLDKLAEKGKTGVLYPLGEGIAPVAGESIISLFGEDPAIKYSGSSCLEAIANDKVFAQDEMLAIASFAEYEEDRPVDLRPNLSFESIKQLKEKLNDEIKLPKADFKLHVISENKLLAIFKSEEFFSSCVTNSHPEYEKLEDELVHVRTRYLSKEPEVEPLEISTGTEYTASVLNNLTQQTEQVLESSELPVNQILFRGVSTNIPHLEEKQEWAMLGKTNEVKAIGELSNMRVESTPEDYNKIIDKLKRISGNYPRIFVELNNLDRYAYEDEPLKKAEKIEEVDSNLFKKLANEEIFEQESIVCFTSDHLSECKRKGYSDIPAPILLFDTGEKLEPDGVNSFTEKEVEAGSLGEIDSGVELFRLLEEFAER